MRNLSRDQMKKVIGGDDENLGGGPCFSDADCGISIVVCTSTTTVVQNKCNSGICVHAGCPS